MISRVLFNLLRRLSVRRYEPTRPNSKNYGHILSLNCVRKPLPTDRTPVVQLTTAPDAFSVHRDYFHHFPMLRPSLPESHYSDEINSHLYRHRVPSSVIVRPLHVRGIVGFESEDVKREFSLVSGLFKGAVEN